MEQMPKAFSYYRFSHPSQRLGDSARRQIDSARKYADAHGLVLDSSLRDEGRSGWSGAHVGPSGSLGAFYRRVAAGEVPPFSTLIVEAMDRLSRQDVLEALSQFIALLKADIRVVTLVDGREYDRISVNRNPMDLQYSIMLMATANTESNNKSDRLDKANAEKLKRIRGGEKVFRGMLPGWLLRDSAGVVVGNPVKVTIIEEVLRLAADGVGMVSIARQLNLASKPIISSSPRRMANGQWSSASVSHLIWNNALQGTYQPYRGTGGRNRVPDGDPVHDHFPVVVDVDLLMKARAGVQRRKDLITGGRNGKIINIFQGIANCYVCGGRMELQRGGQRGRPAYLRCATWLRASRRPSRCDNQSRYHYTALEDTILRQVAHVLLEDAEQDDLTVPLKARRSCAIREAEDARARIRRLLDAIEAGEDAPPRVLEQRLRERQREVDVLEGEVAQLDRAIEKASVRERPSQVQDAVRRLLQEVKDKDEAVSYPARLKMRDELRKVLGFVGLDRTSDPRDPSWKIATINGWATMESREGRWRFRAIRAASDASPEHKEELEAALRNLPGSGIRDRIRAPVQGEVCS